MKISCRICGEPTQYSGTKLIGMVHCSKPECKEASRLLKNKKLQGAWSKVPRISQEEQMLIPWAQTNGFENSFKVVPFIPGINSPRTYTLDFARPNAQLCIEIDGSSHNNRQDRDMRRDRILHSLGWTVKRVDALWVRNHLSEVETMLTEWSNQFPAKPTAESIQKTCEICSTPMERPINISPANWSKRRFCSFTCMNVWKAETQRGKPGPRLGRKNKGPSKASYILCRICGEPTKYQGTPNHPRWGTKACDKPECQAASRLLTRQNQSQALTGNANLIAGVTRSWAKRKGIESED